MHLWAQFAQVCQHDFYLKPDLFIQDRQWHSNLQHLGQQGGQEGYNQALQTFKKASKIAIAKQRRGSLGKKQSKIAGSNRRGKTPVNKKKLSAARRQLGKEGGCKFSGNGSSQKLVKAKVRKMLRYFKYVFHMAKQKVGCWEMESFVSFVGPCKSWTCQVKMQKQTDRW